MLGALDGKFLRLAALGCLGGLGSLASTVRPAWTLCLFFLPFISFAFNLLQKLRGSLR